MMFRDKKGKPIKIKKSYRFLIDWDKPCRSKLQFGVKKLLQSFWKDDIVFEELPVIGTRLTLDFYNANRKIAIEVDGNQHYQFNKHFHGNDQKKFISQLQRDEVKEEFCERNQIRLVRLFESEIIDQKLLKELSLI